MISTWLAWPLEDAELVSCEVCNEARLAEISMTLNFVRS